MNKRFSKRVTSLGFTLVELLAAIAIIAILSALILIGFTQVRQSMMKAQCVSNLRQIGVASQLYVAEEHAFPPGNMHKALLPYLEMQPPYYDLYCCPADPRVDEWKTEASTPPPAGEEPVDIYPGRRSSYAYNTRLIGFATEINRWNSMCWVKAKTLPTEVENPAEIFFMYDSNNFYYGDFIVRTADFRHGGDISVLYVDGHVGSFTEGSEEFYMREHWE